MACKLLYLCRFNQIFIVMKKTLQALALLLFLGHAAYAQSISSENVEFNLLQQPKENIDPANRNFKVIVNSPYNLTADDVIKNAKAEHQRNLANYSTVVANSEKEYQQKVRDYDTDVANAQKKYELEMQEFKKLSMLERLTLTDQGKAPKLVTPAKPVYYKPQPPVYYEPNLNDYLIVDNKVLATQIAIEGFERGAGYVDIMVDIQPVSFQDNAGQTYIKQPTKLVLKIAGKEKVNTVFFNEYAFLTSVPSNNINKPREEKNHLYKVIKFLNDYLNQNYGYSAVKKVVKISTVKNKGKYDDLERADIYVKTNLRKLQPTVSEMNDAAYAGMQKGIDIWMETLTKVDYKNKKADLNADIAQYIYFNLIRLNLAMGKKKEAEKFLNQLQENLIYIKLSYDEENELKRLEAETYKK